MVQYFDKSLILLKGIIDMVQHSQQAIGQKKSTHAALCKEVINRLLKKCHDYTIVSVAANIQKMYMETQLGVLECFSNLFNQVGEIAETIEEQLAVMRLNMEGKEGDLMIDNLLEQHINGTLWPLLNNPSNAYRVVSCQCSAKSQQPFIERDIGYESGAE